MFTHLQDVSGFAYCAGLLHAAFGLFHSGCDAFYFAIFLYIHTASALGFFFLFFQLLQSTDVKEDAVLCCSMEVWNILTHIHTHTQ